MLRQVAKAGLDVRRPPIVPFLDRLADAERLQLEPRHGQVHKFFLRDGRHTEALVILEDDEIVGDQSHQRLAKRAETGPVPHPQILEAQTRTGREATLEDVATKPLEDVGGDCARRLTFGGSADSRHV